MYSEEWEKEQHLHYNNRWNTFGLSDYNICYIQCLKWCYVIFIHKKRQLNRS